MKDGAKDEIHSKRGAVDRMTTTGIVIETRRTSRRRFRAYVAEGPAWLSGYQAEEATAKGAYEALRRDVRADLIAAFGERGKDSFDFIHAEC
jgi:hypothetical protein